MDTRRPPVLGALLKVIPAVRVQRRPPWTLTLVSVERWDTCVVASFGLLQDGPVDHSTGRHPLARHERRRRPCRSLRVLARRRLRRWTGRRQRQHRSIVKFTQPLDTAAGDLSIEIAEVQATTVEPDEQRSG